ncbi:MAG: DUF935 family protein [Phycisphaerae bacterium]|nr:DUF935 family protein [Phycisphaerae bacterium]
MSWARRVANALGGRKRRTGFEQYRGRESRPPLGLLIGPSALDRWRDYPADGLTPGRLADILRAADEGAVDQAMALFEQMEEKDGHLYSVANTRRRAVTGLRWQIESAADVREGVDRGPADEAADYCREVLAGIDRFDETLQHLSLALGRNIALAENVWDFQKGELRLVDVVPVDFGRVAFGELGEPRVLTGSAPYDGIALPPAKFIVHTPHAVSGHPMRGGLLRVSALSYLGKHFAMKDWMVFAEVFGMPVRVARYEPSATAQEKRELLSMLQAMGTDASAIFSKAVELQMFEAGHGTGSPPYEGMCAFFNREISKAWLGQTLTVETSGETGTYAAAVIHNEVRLDLRQDDLGKEARTIRRDVLAPLTRMRFGPGVPVPFFRRPLDPPRDLRELADVLSAAVNDLRLAVPVRWAYDALGIPPAREGEAVLRGTSPADSLVRAEPNAGP